MLDKVCETAPSDLAETADAECGINPGSCGHGAVCCSGLCHGLNINTTIATECPPGTL